MCGIFHEEFRILHQEELCDLFRSHFVVRKVKCRSVSGKSVNSVSRISHPARWSMGRVSLTTEGQPNRKLYNCQSDSR